MTAPTPSAGERARAQAIVAEWYPAISPKLYREKLAESIAHALATARAEGAQAERDAITKHAVNMAIPAPEISSPHHGCWNDAMEYWYEWAKARERAALAGEATDG